jgi:hypothetical protein
MTYPYMCKLISSMIKYHVGSVLYNTMDDSFKGGNIYF